MGCGCKDKNKQEKELEAKRIKDGKVSAKQYLEQLRRSKK